MEKTGLVICDTDVLIDFLDRSNGEVTSQLLQIGFENISIASITAPELLLGARDKKHFTTLNRFLENLIHIYINPEISAGHLELIKKYALSHKLKVQDALIAATAINLKLPLYTLNIKDFKFINGLSLYAQ